MPRYTAPFSSRCKEKFRCGGLSNVRVSLAEG